MNDIEEIARNQIFSNSPNIKVYHKNNPTQEVKISTVTLDTTGRIIFVTTNQGEEIYSEDLIINENFLDVPGVGYLKPHTKVRLDTDSTTYELLFGWHTNISNQTIYSWYLRPIMEYEEENPGNYMSCFPDKLSQDRTLYYDMINHLWEISV